MDPAGSRHPRRSAPRDRPLRDQEGDRRAGPTDRAIVAVPSPGATACSRGARPGQDPRRARPWPGSAAAAFARLQFTPDLLPVRPRRHPHLPGVERRASTSSSAPVFVNFVLADEINRAPAKVQSALLEVMAEHQVSIGGADASPCPEPFLVLATPEPDRERGRLPAARRAARPVPHEDPPRLPHPHRGGSWSSLRMGVNAAARRSVVFGIDEVDLGPPGPPPTRSTSTAPLTRLRRQRRVRHATRPASPGPT